MKRGESMARESADEEMISLYRSLIVGREKHNRVLGSQIQKNRADIEAFRKKIAEFEYKILRSAG